MGRGVGVSGILDEGRGSGMRRLIDYACCADYLDCLGGVREFGVWVCKVVWLCFAYCGGDGDDVICAGLGYCLAALGSISFLFLDGYTCKNFLHGEITPSI